MQWHLTASKSKVVTRMKLNLRAVCWNCCFSSQKLRESMKFFLSVWSNICPQCSYNCHKLLENMRANINRAWCHSPFSCEQSRGKWTTLEVLQRCGVFEHAQYTVHNFSWFPTGQEYSIPSPFQRLLAETVDFFILFFIKATIIISIMHLSGIK